MNPLATRSTMDSPRERRFSTRTSYRVCKGGEFDGSLCVTVDTSQILRVRRAIVQSGCTPIGIVKAAPLACGTRARLVIALRQEHVDRVMQAITRATEKSDRAA